MENLAKQRFLFQRISIAIQKGNDLAYHSTFQTEPNVYPQGRPCQTSPISNQIYKSTGAVLVAEKKY